MKKTKLAALALCFALLVCALTGVACGPQTDTGGKTEWSFGADLPVACEENDKVSIVLNVEGADDYEVVYEVVFGTTQVEVSEGGEFTPAAAGTYTVKVKVTAKGETKEKTYTLTVAKDATDPVITTKIADKTVEKGEYNFAGDLAEIVAADNKTQAENLVKSIVSVTLDGTALEMTENACTFERAGEYNVSYQVTDEEGNSANASYKITVKGLYLNEKAFVSKVFQLAEYEIAEAKVYGIENAAVKVTLAQGDEINEVAMGAKVKFLNVSDAVLKYVLTVGEEEKEIIEKTVKITALDLMISAADFSATEGDEITIPSASLSHETAGVTVSVKISGQYQEEQTVAQGDKITAASGVTYITYTAENEDKSFSLTRVISVVAIGKDEIVSFEQVNGDNPDFNVPPLGMKLGNEELNSDPAYVHSGKYSAKLIFGPQRPNANTFGAGFCYWDNQIRNANVEGANGISMWIYCAKKEAYIVAAIATGATGKGYSGARISHVIKLGKGWNEVNINFDYQVYDAGEKTAADGTVLGALDIKNGISELCFYRVEKGAYTHWDSVNGGNYTDYIYDNALSVYVDEVRIRKFEIPDGVYFTFDKKPEATGTIGGTAVATAPRMLVEEGVTLTVAVTAPNGEQTTVNAGDSFDLTLGGYYTLTYKAEKEGKPTQEVSFQVLATDPAEFLSFETINGATPDIAKGVYGNVTANTDSQYVKVGKQSAKLETVLNEWGNCTAGFAWDVGALQMPTVENANALTFWMYSEKELYLYATVTTGVSANNTWVCKTSKPIALSVGWNFVTLDVRYSFDALGLDFNNGLQELYFRTGDANAVGKTPATLYIDSVCFANLEIPDGLYFVFDSKPETTGTMGGTAVATAPRMLVEEGVTLTVAVTAPNGEQTTVNAGDSFDLTLGGYYTLTYKAEKEGKPSQEESFRILATVPGEFMSFEDVNGSVPEIANGVYGTVIANTDAAYVKSGSQSAKLVFGINNTPAGTHQAGFVDWSAKYKPDIEGANGIAFWVHSDINAYLYANISTGSGSAYSGAKTSKAIELKTGWNYVEININSDMASSGVKIADGIAELFFRLGSDANGADMSGNITATLYIDSVCFSVLPDRVIENLAIDYMNINLPEDQTVLGDREFGMVTRCTDEEYTKNGKPSLKLEMFADEAPLKTMRACYSGWGKGILLTAGENAVKFDVYASRAAFVSFEFGTGGNAGSGAYSGAKFAKVIELKQGWNTVTITFGDNADVQGATLADGIVHFGATTVNSISALPDNGCFPDVASEELTLYVATMYAIVA